MNYEETIRRLRAEGLMPVVDQARAMIPRARLLVGKNDIVIFAFVDDEGKATLEGGEREAALRVLRETTPQAENTIRILSPLPPVTRVPLVIVTGTTFYALRLTLTDLTGGVLN